MSNGRSVGPSVLRLVTSYFFGLLEATNAVYTALFSSETHFSVGAALFQTSVTLDRRGKQARSRKYAVRGALAIVMDPSHVKIASSLGWPLLIYYRHLSFEDSSLQNGGEILPRQNSGPLSPHLPSAAVIAIIIIFVVVIFSYSTHFFFGAAIFERPSPSNGGEIRPAL